MPKNKGKGGKNRRRGKNENDYVKRELIVKEAGQEYAQVARMLGNGRLEALCMDGQKRLCHIRGKLRKKDNKADVILRYLPEEARQLKNMGAIPAHININEATGFDKQGADGDGEVVIFDDDAEGASSSDEDNDHRRTEKYADVSPSSEEDESDDEEDSDTGLVVKTETDQRKVTFKKSVNKVQLSPSYEDESDEAERIVPMFSKDKRRVFQPDEDCY
ncbi:hypothetical protein GJ496_005840 [Pomphorhynchus laevis]|nr:hypothetical protein GJ496_005840 [Pomphorhynchus laevis]